MGDQALDEPFSVRKVLLPTAGATIRLRLGKGERPRHRGRAVAAPALWPPVQLQRLPDGSPILRGGFHDDFFDLALDEPVGKRAQLVGARPNLHALELVLLIDFDVSHHNGQHPFVDVNSRDQVWHRPLLGERRACLVASVRVASCRRMSHKHRTMLNYSINHARSRSNSCSASTAPLARFDLAAPAGAILTGTLIFMAFRGLQAQG